MMKKSFLTAVFIYSTFSLNAVASQVVAQTAFEGETFNFELSGQKNWDYDLKRIKVNNKTKVQLFVKSLDEVGIDKIRNTENPFVESINVTRNTVDNKWLIEFTLKNANTETFDYLTDQPSKLIVDFYKSETALADVQDAEQAEAAKKAKLAAIEKSNDTKLTAKDKSAAKINRTPADVDFLKIDKEDGIATSVLARAGLFDAGDAQFKRFNMNESDYKDESVIKSKTNYYLKFPVLETDFSFWKKMKENPPEYEVKPENTDENKQARLLKTLFDRKRFLVFVQTSDWFKAKFPKSKYIEMISYMRGEAFAQLWHDLKDATFYDQAQNAYREALEAYPDSVLSERTSLLIGLMANERADYMYAIRKLNAHLNNKKYDGKISQTYAKLAVAYSYSKMQRLTEAMNLLSDIEKQTKDELVLTEIAVRKGDFNFYNKKLPESIAAYAAADKKYPYVSKLFPSAYFNRMEALFWDHRFKESHQAALDFAQYFPAHEYAPYALTRVGELLDIMGAEQSKSVGAFLETHFRYGNSPKTIVAKLYLLSTKMKNMKTEELDQTLTKMEELAAKSDLQNVDQFKVTMLADGFSKRKDFLRAIQILSDFYQKNPTRPDVKQVTQRIIRNISDELKNLSDVGNYKKLLKTYKQYSDTWLKTQSRIDTDYFLGLSYESAGAYTAALEKFKKVQADIQKIQGTAFEKEAYVNQYLPTMDALNLKLAKNSFENQSPQEAYQLLEKIKKPLGLSEAEQIDRVYLAASLFEAKGDTGTAIRYLSELTDLWKGDEKLALPVQFKLAQMQSQHKDVDGAVATYEKCRETLLKNKNSKESDVVKLANSYAQLLVSETRNDEAIKMLSEVITKFDNQFEMSQERYLLGDLLYKKGEIKKAETAWEKIKDDEQNIWKKLSAEKLKQAAWDTNYKKHIKRIPAMSQLEEAK